MLYMYIYTFQEIGKKVSYYFYDTQGVNNLLIKNTTNQHTHISNTPEEEMYKEQKMTIQKLLMNTK